METLHELTADPARAAILLDVDGVLAPIVRDPNAARVPETTRSELRRLAGRYALVACVSGRTGDDAARIVGVDGIVYVGEHGLELESEAQQWRSALDRFTSAPGWPVERKPLTLSLHYRQAPDPEAAAALLLDVAERASAEGLVARWGRMVLELRPPVPADKGTAISRLLSERSITRALYAGDDTTDLDAFRALDAIDLGVRVAVASEEGPRELREQADVIVAGPAELLELLRQL